MSLSSPLTKPMPDVASEAEPTIGGVLDWVGMGRIQAPVMVLGGQGEVMRCPARVDAFVDLNQPAVRGIHMSRLYLHLDQALSSETLTPKVVHQLLRQFLDSHHELSTRAMLRIEFDYLLRRAALRSDNAGWKSYPVTIVARLEGDRFELELGCEVLYSSTCPASAALARQLIQQGFDQAFPEDAAIARGDLREWLGSEQGISATPHSQRSVAQVKVKLGAAVDMFPLVALLDLIEDAVKTPVQTAVKREDEQAFAALNGSNLMFCEDAARRLQKALNGDARVLDFKVQVSHFESLHPHDAVAVASKGVAGGYRAGLAD